MGGSTRGALIGGSMDPVGGPILGAHLGHGKGHHPQPAPAGPPPPNVNWRTDPNAPPPAAPTATTPYADLWNPGGQYTGAWPGAAGGKGMPAPQGGGAQTAMMTRPSGKG